MEDKLAKSIFNEVNQFLKTGNWAKAREYCDLILKSQPSNAQAYVGKLMADYEVDSPDKLCDVQRPLETNENYLKAIQYADKETASVLQEYNRYTVVKNRPVVTAPPAGTNEKQKREHSGRGGHILKTLLKILLLGAAIAVLLYCILQKDRKSQSHGIDSLLTGKKVWTPARNDSKKEYNPVDTIVMEGNSYYQLRDEHYYLVVTLKNCFNIIYTGTQEFGFYDKDDKLLGTVKQDITLKPGKTVELKLKLPNALTPEQIKYYSATYTVPDGYGEKDN